MSQILKLTHENQQLKRQVSQYKQVLGVSPYVNDSLFKGGYRVVKTINDRDKIDCCHRKQGMKVIVVGEDLSFKEYILKTDNCKENTWEEISVTVEENEVFLIEDYSELSEDLITQKDLNLVLKDLILNLQSQIDNIELLDEKVQITEATNFAQIGQNQKDFNKKVSDYKASSDLKNQEQDDRMSDIESENVAQNDLINGLQTTLDGKLDKGTYTGTAQDLKNNIDSKLNKPTSTGNTTTYPFVIGENGNGNSARLPAGDLGKNFFNSDLSNTTARTHTMNAAVTVNTLGNAWNMLDLPDRTSDTTNFDAVVKYNRTTGQFAYGQAFIYNVPSTITVNNINTPTVLDPPTYVTDIQNRLTQLNSVSMQKFTTWNIVTYNNITNANIRVNNNDTIYTFADAFNSAGIPNETSVISINTEKVLPTTSDWAIRFSTFVSHDGSKSVGNLGAIVANRLIGLFTGNPTSIVAPILFIKDSASDHLNRLLLGTKFVEGSAVGTSTSNSIYTGTNYNNAVQVTILKVNTVILFQVQHLGNTISEIYQASLIGENCGFTVSVVKPNANFNNSVSVTSSIRYYIFP